MSFSLEQDGEKTLSQLEGGEKEVYYDLNQGLTQIADKRDNKVKEI